ncbi:MAG: MATE family efflux transporter, partial [Anaerolineales bacterium]|nr:MATE family efflux transporter [Anaerolineales bacterium]
MEELTITQPAKEIDLTSGGLHKAIWILAPAMILETGILNVTQILDTYWVSRLGSAALAAVTISISIRWVLNSLANGLGIGGMAVVARRTGEKNREAANHAAWQTILLAFFVSIVMTVLGLIIAEPVLVLLGAEAEVLPLGMAYLRVLFLGIFTIVLTFGINALFRGAGEPRLAMIVLFVATAVNVVLEPVLMFGLGPIPAMGVAGSAWANVLGFGSAVLLQFIILVRGKATIAINMRNLRPDFPLMGHIIRIALPSTAQMTFRSSSRLVILAIVGVYGTYVVAGYGIANRLLLIALIPVFGMANAASTLVGQNLGARQPERAEQSAWWVTAYSIGYMVVMVILLTIFAHPLIMFFDSTPEVVKMGTECTRIVAFSLLAQAVGVVMERGFDGA